MTDDRTVTGITWHKHQHATDFARAVADRLTTAMQDGLQHRQSASFVVPGGTTPGPAFDDLAMRNLDWSRVSVTLTDERWVPTSDPASNEALLRQRLLVGKARSAGVISLHTTADRPSDGIAEVSKRLNALPLPFDAVLLGMGGDGHFASLFPNMPDLAEGLALENTAFCLASDQPINGQPRLSLTLQLLLRSRVLLLAIKGADKLQVIERAKTAEPLKLPVAAILQQNRVPVEIHYTD
jgi:6-phosphogluconolactonase